MKVKIYFGHNYPVYLPNYLDFSISFYCGYILTTFKYILDIYLSLSTGTYLKWQFLYNLLYYLFIYLFIVCSSSMSLPVQFIQNFGFNMLGRQPILGGNPSWEATVLVIFQGSCWYLKYTWILRRPHILRKITRKILFDFWVSVLEIYCFSTKQAVPALH